MYLSGDDKLTMAESPDNYSAHNENISIRIEIEYSREDNQSFRTIYDDEESKESNQEDMNDDFEYNDHESYESDDTNNEDMHSDTESDLSDTINNTTENDNWDDDDACLKKLLAKTIFQMRVLMKEFVN